MAMASSTNNTPPSPTVRFLGHIKQPSDPESNDNPFELDESDVIWSPSSSTSRPRSPPPPKSTTPISFRHYQFRQEKSGLSAALSDDHHPLVRRKPTLNPSLSAASAARTIPPVPQLRPEKKFPQSAPVNVPVWPKSVGGSGASRFLDEVEEEESDEEMIPPHEIVARSHATTFSVFEGVGRTLKGRDLRKVRNAVFQKTGFID